MQLYQKYRPKNFDEFFGNEQIIKTIKGFLSKKQKPKSWLFHGDSGVGKTTLAKIIAKELGAFGSDFLELNSADYRGIDSVRDLIEKLHLSPQEEQSTCKVYLLDECHKLTTDAQNALLKPLEDKSSNVYFILCTTEPTKLISTIKSRCIQLPLKPLDKKETYKLLKSIVEREEETLDFKYYKDIYEVSVGKSRSTLNCLEILLNTEENARDNVWLEEGECKADLIELPRILYKNTEWENVSSILDKLKNIEPEVLRKVMLSYYQKVLLSRGGDRAALVIEMFSEPFYDSGFAGVVYACYVINKS